jgi:heptaprenyl diphosphate synthase
VVKSNTLFLTIEKELNIVDQNMLQITQNESSHSKKISGILIQILSNPGKRIRPTITLLSSKLWGEPENQENIDIATAVELIHLATLLHDDTVDQAKQRRGEETPSSLWGKEVAILLGDYIFAISAIFVSKVTNATIAMRFANTIVELSRGELSEFLDRGISTINKKTYFDRIYNKTGSLFKTASLCGALTGLADKSGIKAMEKFGYNLGMAFQIQDDIIDFESKSIITGKPSVKDLSEGILTLPSIIFIKDYPSKNPLIHFLNEYPDFSIKKYQDAKNAILNSDSLKKSRLVVDKYINKALKNLESIPVSEHKDSLIELVNNIHERNR